MKSPAMSSPTGRACAAPAIGAAVGVAWHGAACGQCEYCLNRLETICPQAEATGYTRDGGYAELSPPAPTSSHPSRTARIYVHRPGALRRGHHLSGLKNSRARPGQFAAIIGAGGLGHIAIQYAKAMGLRPSRSTCRPGQARTRPPLGAEMVFNAVEARHPRAGGNRRRLPCGARHRHDPRRLRAGHRHHPRRRHHCVHRHPAHATG